MIEIREGLELDCEVAEATGDVGCCGCLPDYSTELNAAFEAGEKVGLFGDYVLRRHPNGLWAMCEIGIEDEGYPAYSVRGPCYIDFTPNDYPTPALAICAAILKLKENA